MDELEWLRHTCRLEQAKYIVIYETELDYEYRNDNQHICFEELKWAKECYAQYKVGTGYPTIIRSRLVECKGIKNETSKKRNRYRS